MSQLGNEWTNADGNIMRFRDEFLDEKVDTARLPFSTQVDGLVYHSNIPRIMLSNRMIDLRKPLTPEEQALLRQTMPKSRGQAVQQFQADFKAKKERESANARTNFFKTSQQGQKEVFDRRYEQYLKDHPEQVAFEKIVGGLTKGADFIIDKAGSVVPFVADIYKKFAPKGSQFYTDKSIEQKFAEIGKAKAGDLGKKLVG